MSVNACNMDELDKVAAKPTPMLRKFELFAIRKWQTIFLPLYVHNFVAQVSTTHSGSRTPTSIDNVEDGKLGSLSKFRN